MTDLEELRAYLAAHAGAYEDMPFGPETLVFKVGGKMFGLIALEQAPLNISLKCDPLKAEHLREAYPAIALPRYLDKRHWNTIRLDGSLPDGLVPALIDESYQLVVRGLSKAAQRALAGGPPAA
jgi:predicted DNA-binding protein (MmcQ/YjbR family)